MEGSVLVDAGEIAGDAGFRFPVAVTVAAWADCVAWTDADSVSQVRQNQAGRLFDVLFMARHAIRSSRSGGDRLTFQLHRVPRDGTSTGPAVTTLKLIVGPGDEGEPVVTILPNED